VKPMYIRRAAGIKRWCMSVKLPEHSNCKYMAAFTHLQDAITEQNRIYAILNVKSKKGDWSVKTASRVVGPGRCCLPRHLLAPSPSTIRDLRSERDVPGSGNSCRPANRPGFRFARVNNPSNRPS